MDFESKSQASSDPLAINGGEGPAIPDGTAFTITDLAEAFGVTTRALRYYEDHDLIRPQRRGQARIYSRADAARLAWVLRGKRVGFSLSEIGELLDLYDKQDGRARQRMKTIEMCRSRVSDLEAQRRDLDLVISELKQFCTTLENLVDNTKAAKA